MNLLSWNCQELENLRTLKALEKVTNKEELDIAFLMDTKLNEEWMKMVKKMQHEIRINCVKQGKEWWVGLVIEGRF